MRGRSDQLQRLQQGVSHGDEREFGDRAENRLPSRSSGFKLAQQATDLMDRLQFFRDRFARFSFCFPDRFFANQHNVAA